MTVYVSFFRPSPIGVASAAPGIGAIRVRESLVIPASTVAIYQQGEAAIVVNGESGPIAVAFGSSPDADSVASSAATTAGVVIPAGAWLPIVGAAGDKINVKSII